MNKCINQSTFSIPSALKVFTHQMHCFACLLFLFFLNIESDNFHTECERNGVRKWGGRARVIPNNMSGCTMASQAVDGRTSHETCLAAAA